jgi:sialate O-acetylesterase
MRWHRLATWLFVGPAVIALVASVATAGAWARTHLTGPGSSLDVAANDSHAASGLAPGPQQAPGSALTVPTMFSDNAVLQRGMAVPVFGTAAPGTNVTVTFNDQQKSTNASPDGKWQVELDPMTTLATPGDMVITSGAERIVRAGIQVGEVWFGSGQSNMARDLTWDTDYASAVASAGAYNLRLFNISASGTPASTVWQVSNSTTAAGFSATLFFFGRYLAQQMPGVPIGLMTAARSATSIDTWSTAVGSGGNYLAMVKPVQPYAIRGVSWYQGEWDAKSAGDAEGYYAELPMLINEWRMDWGEGSFPFYIVQMPRLGISQVHIVRDAELRTAMTVPNTAISIHIDYPEVNVHPPAKESFGRRQAYLALRNIYGFDIEESGPIANIGLSSVKGNQVVVGFDHVGGGLTTGGSPLAQWQLASSPGGGYVQATAHIAGSTVVVSSSSVPNPACVRYAFAAAPADHTTFLYNLEGMGASPIREMCPAAAPTSVMHVEDLYTTDVSGSPQSVFVAPGTISYRVKIVDQNGNPVSGAAVTTALLRPDGQRWTTQAATTGTDGWALFSKAVTKAQKKGLYTINVTNVAKSGAAYSPGANVRGWTTFTLQ